MYRRIKEFLIGKPLATHIARHEKISKKKALAILSSDALSSVAYATEQVLLPLAAYGTAALVWSVPIALCIGLLLLILTVSYRQTIQHYPQGGGAYTVARENIGETAGLVAAAALMVDYTLTVSVSVTAGIAAITSAFPWLAEHRVIMCLAAVFLVMTINLRGIRESATIFAFPTYAFIFSILAMIVVGALKAGTAGSGAASVLIPSEYTSIPVLLFLKAFASGCTALTGVEAISNSVPAFREPETRNAKMTMGWMAAILAAMFLGITALANVYGIIPHEGETAVSLLARRVFGEHGFYYFIQATTALILFLAANTSYTAFPRLTSMLANDTYLPRQLATQGDKLVYSNGILWLSFVAGLLVAIFGGVTDRLIPLYATGVFLSFTLSQSGMVIRHWKLREPHWRKGILFNGIGAITTAVALVVIASFRFLHGAWVVVIVLPLMVAIFKGIKAHFRSVARQLDVKSLDPSIVDRPMKHTVILPIAGIHRGVIEALRYAKSISNDVRAVYVEIQPGSGERVLKEWQPWSHGVPLYVLASPYRSLLDPLLKFIDEVERERDDDIITVLVPEFVTDKIWQSILHNQTAFQIRTALLFRPRKVVTSVRYHLH